MSAIPYLISSMIAAEKDPVVLNTVFDLLEPADIGSSYGALFSILRSCWRDHHIIEPVVVTNEVKAKYNDESHRRKLFDQMYEISDLVLSSDYWQHYLKQTLAEVKVSRLISLASDVGGRDMQIKDIDSILNQSKAEIERISEKYRIESPRDMNAITKDYLAMIDAEMSGYAPSRVKTGLYYEKYIKGFRAGDYVILAGRPKMGKSALATTIAVKAMQAGKRVMFVNNEMDENSMLNRIISCTFRFPIEKLQEPDRLLDSDAELVMQYVEAVRKLPLELYCFRFGTITQVSDEVRRLREIGRSVDLVILDYLQLFGTGEKYKSKYEEVSTLSWQTKLLAANNSVPVLALSQLNRKCEERTNKRPTPSDLRDSGSLEQDATALMFIYRDEVYNENTQDIGIAEISVAANRNGKTGWDKYFVDFDHMTIGNLDNSNVGEYNG